MRRLKSFFFKRGKNNIGELLSLLVVFSGLQFVNYTVIRNNLLLFIPLILSIIVIFRICDTWFDQLLGNKNKVIGTGSYFFVIFLFIIVTTYIG
ncbi:hypothetical protein AWM68_03040 [Fictibacillus phosphorivorans]|uniref:Uncharacterized protein n=1 Tax=Fictibacillus phosphorivorans TaxID=1221500 RepID=A0A163SJT2_9BACL|nr:hypothetical protein [Fictibacillus phosphorivorans]KZE69258.1 hypothetical protein AWM68_03040 [Fictibacillus phosphorivorans]